MVYNIRRTVPQLSIHHRPLILQVDLAFNLIYNDGIKLRIGETMQTAVIHACKVGSDEVLATNEQISYYPPPRMGPEAQDAFLHFGVEWDEGISTRSGFLVKVDNSQGENHFDLVMEGDDPKTSRVGLRPWAYGKPNPSANVIWAQQGIEPRDWLH